MDHWVIGLKKLVRNKCTTNNVPLCEYSDIESLSRAVGKGAVSVVGTGDNGFANEILKKIAAKNGS